MRKKIKKDPPIGVGSKRRIAKFLWAPLVIGDERRWLEKAVWEEEVTEWTWRAAHSVSPIQCIKARVPMPSPWRKVRWIDDS